MAEFTLQEFEQQIAAAVIDLTQSLPEIGQRLALNAKAMIVYRFQQVGTDADGAELSPYSEAYNKRRDKKGLNVKPNRLTFSGNMFRSTGLIEQNREASGYVVTIAGRDDDAQNRLDWNSDRYGDVLKLSKQEEDSLQETYTNEVQKILERHGI